MIVVYIIGKSIELILLSVIHIKSYFATEANDIFFDSKEQTTPDHPIFNKRGVPFKGNTPLTNEMLAGIMSNYHFESFYDAFFNKNIDFKELRSKLS